MNRVPRRTAFRGITAALRPSRLQTSPQRWQVDIADDGVSILWSLAESPESTGTTVRLNSEEAMRLSHELKSAARKTAGQLSTETFIPAHVLGMTCSEATAMLRALGLNVVVDGGSGEEPVSTASGGRLVVGVDPPAETVLSRASLVRLEVSSGVTNRRDVSR